MGEGVLYLLTSFWLGAIHAATPGHGKTIAASYIVGVRGRPVDALVLGIFVTLSHTSGIVLVAILATLGSAWLIPQRIEVYLALGTGVLIIWIGCWMLRTQMRVLPVGRAWGDSRKDRVDVPEADALEERHDGANGPKNPAHSHPHDHSPHYHRHGWGLSHTHDIEAITRVRPSLAILLGLGIAGGLLPDPGALAILLAAIASGKANSRAFYCAGLQPGLCIRPCRRGRGCGKRGTTHPRLAEQPLDRMGSDRGGAADSWGRPRPDRKRLAEPGRN